VTVGQQAHDAAVIIKAIGSGKAIVFGNSGRGILGLELAAVKLEVIDFLIVHEAPVIELLPDAEKWRSFHDKHLYEKPVQRLGGAISQIHGLTDRSLR